MSIIVITYRHEAFILECLSSVLKQKTDFPYEVLVGVDHSDDKTHEICMRFAQMHPEIVRVYLNDPDNVSVIRGRRVGRNNFLNVFNRTRGKYIAICDGDDYWCDPLKLQKQVDVLERHPESVACHHWHYYAYPDQAGVYQLTDAPTTNQGYLPQEISTLRDVFANRIRLKSRTVMYRNIVKPLPEIFNQVAFGDVTLSVIYGMHGNFRFINEPMAVYRQTGRGVSTSGYNKRFVLNHQIDWIDLWERCDIFSRGVYRAEAISAIVGFYAVILKKYGYRIDYFLRCIIQCLVKSNYPIALRLVILRRLVSVFFCRL